MKLCSFLLLPTVIALLGAGVSPATEPNELSREEKAAGWRLLFNGYSLEGWRASEALGSFRVEDGAIVAEGERSHLYFAGDIPEGGFRNFVLTTEVQTTPGANSGIYFHTSFQETGWPAAGYEVQLNNSDPPGSAPSSNPSRSGSLWGIVNLPEAIVPDGQWFALEIRVEGKRIVTKIDGQAVVDYMEPAALLRPVNLAGKALSSGTFALQASNPTSPVLFRSIKLLPLDGAKVTDAPIAPGVPREEFGRDAVAGKTFRMHWMRGNDLGVLREISLHTDGTIAGAPSENESRWGIDDSGDLAFFGPGGQVTSVFATQSLSDGQWILSGVSLVAEDIRFRLDEKLKLPELLDDEALNRIIRPWSKQRIISLDQGESYRWQTSDGKTKTIRLVGVEETRDPVLNLVRKADVTVEIDGDSLDLLCAPYVMPTEIGSMRIQADITSGMVGNLPKQVSLSLWEATDPIVDTEAFRFPLSNHLLFSHDLQAYGEVVWLGIHDGDPKGVTARHSYGIDLGGYENGVEVLAVADGVVHDVFPDTRDPYAALIRSANGVVWEYGHLQSLLPGIREGAVIRAGQPLGMLGKRGGSGNFSHLHIGLHPSPAHRTAVIRTQRLNFFPWIVAAYRAQQPQALIAIAGPHQVTRAGETCFFDGSHSLSFGSEIARYRWKFPDGQIQEGPRAENGFSEPGVYIVELALQDKKDREDIAFCRVKVFPTTSKVDTIPTLFMTHTPTVGIRPGQPVKIRGWVQGEEDAPIRLEFGDGQVMESYQSYEEVTHTFDRPGIHVITGTTEIGGMPITQKHKVLVTVDGGPDAQPTAEVPEVEIPKTMAPGLGGAGNSAVESIVLGAGRSPDGSLLNPGLPLPEGLKTLSADVELVNLTRGEKVQVWLEQGDKHTAPIDANIQGQGRGTIPVDLHLEDTPFPPGIYTFVVMLDGKKRFAQDFKIAERE